MLLNICSFKIKINSTYFTSSNAKTPKIPRMANLHSGEDIFTIRHSVLAGGDRNLVKTTTFGQWSFHKIYKMTTCPRRRRLLSGSRGCRFI